MMRIDFSGLDSTPQFGGNGEDLSSGISSAPEFLIPNTIDVGSASFASSWTLILFSEP